MLRAAADKLPNRMASANTSIPVSLSATFNTLG